MYNNKHFRLSTRWACELKIGELDEHKTKTYTIIAAIHNLLGICVYLCVNRCDCVSVWFGEGRAWPPPQNSTKDVPPQQRKGKTKLDGAATLTLLSFFQHFERHYFKCYDWQHCRRWDVWGRRIEIKFFCLDLGFLSRYCFRCSSRTEDYYVLAPNYSTGGRGWQRVGFEHGTVPSEYHITGKPLSFHLL